MTDIERVVGVREDVCYKDGGHLINNQYCIPHLESITKSNLPLKRIELSYTFVSKYLQKML